jgi:hypothetical protein
MTTTDPNTPAARAALQHMCGLCKARPGEACRTERPGKMHWFRTLGTS